MKSPSKMIRSMERVYSPMRDFAPLTEIGLIPGLLEIIDDSTETARFLLALDKQSFLVRRYLAEGEPSKFPKFAWFRRTKDGTLRTVLMHGTRILFEGRAFYVKGDLPELLSAYRLIRNHAASQALDDYLWFQAGSKRTTPSVAVPPAPEPTPAPKATPMRMRTPPRERQPTPVQDGPPDEIDFGYYPGELDQVDYEFYLQILWTLGRTAKRGKTKLYKPLRPLLAGYRGSKMKALARLAENIPPFRRLVEPFAGSGALSLSIGHLALHLPRITRTMDDSGDTAPPMEFILSDSNPDIVNLYRCTQHAQYRDEVKQHARQLFDDSLRLFEERFTRAEKPTNHKELNEFRKSVRRSIFNPIKAAFKERKIPWLGSGTDDPWLAAAYLYLYTHCHGSFVRYDEVGGITSQPEDFTVFPERSFDEYLSVCDKFQFRHCDSFRDLITDDILDLGDVVYGDVVFCDPPYANGEGNEATPKQFGKPFSRRDQEDLAALAEYHSARGATVIITNNDNQFTQDLYRSADRMTIGIGIGKRTELIAVWLSPQRRESTLVKGVGKSINPMSWSESKNTSEWAPRNQADIALTGCNGAADVLD